MRWRIGKADPDVVQQLTCCLARSMLIYIGTPMMAVGLWKREDINKIEASLYRKIMSIGNDIPNTAVLNTMTNIRLAGEVIYNLSREAQSEYRRQHRVTNYFDRIDGGAAVNAAVGVTSNDVVMNSGDGNNRTTTTINNDVTQPRDNKRDNSNRRTNNTPMARREKIYVPRSMMDLMISTTGNSTSIHFGMGHMCHRHDRLFTLDHIEQCDQLSGCNDIRRYANKLREQHILDWSKEDRMMAIT